MAAVRPPASCKLFVEPRDFQAVTNLRARPIDRVRRKFHNAHRSERYRRDPKWTHVLFHVNDFFFLAEKNEVNREKHSDCVDPAGRHDPKAAAELRPALCFAEQSHEAANIAIGNGSLCGHKCLSRLVVNVHVAILSLTVVGHGPAVSTLMSVVH